MNEFIDFLGFLNTKPYERGLRRMESMLMPANLSSVVGEFIISAVPKHCSTLVKNAYHNGHPDLLPAGTFPGNSVLCGNEGIEVKGSRYSAGWQGHNPEESWLMVVVFDSNRPNDADKGIGPKPFRFKMILLGKLKKRDWTYSGREGKSRRTITAAVSKSGREKLVANWIYKDIPPRKRAKKEVK